MNCENPFKSRNKTISVQSRGIPFCYTDEAVTRLGDTPWEK